MDDSHALDLKGSSPLDTHIFTRRARSAPAGAVGGKRRASAAVSIELARMHIPSNIDLIECCRFLC